MGKEDIRTNDPTSLFSLLVLVATLALTPYLNAGERDPHPGDKLVDFAFTDFSGQQHHRYDFAGHYVLLDFWATWCQPCLQEIPGLLQASQQFRSRGLVIIGMNSDKSVEKAGKFVQEKNIPWLQTP